MRRSEYIQVSNIIIEEEHEKLKTAVTRRKAILSGKRKIIDWKYILIVLEVHDQLAKLKKMRKKRKTTKIKKAERELSEVEQEYIDKPELSQDEQLVILECIEIQ